MRSIEEAAPEGRREGARRAPALDPGRAALPVIGFLSHVNAEAAQAARAAGCPHVLARSAFVQELPGLLAAAARSPGSAEAK